MYHKHRLVKTNLAENPKNCHHQRQTEIVECGRESENDWKKFRTEPGMSRARGYSGKNVPEFSTFKIPILLSYDTLLIESNL